MLLSVLSIKEDSELLMSDWFITILLMGVESNPKDKLLLMILVIPSFQFQSPSFSIPKSFQIKRILFYNCYSSLVGDKVDYTARIDCLCFLIAFLLRIACNLYRQSFYLLSSISLFSLLMLYFSPFVLPFYFPQDFINLQIQLQSSPLKASISMVKVSILSESLAWAVVRIWRYWFRTVRVVR